MPLELEFNKSDCNHIAKTITSFLEHRKNKGGSPDVASASSPLNNEIELKQEAEYRRLINVVRRLNQGRGCIIHALYLKPLIEKILGVKAEIRINQYEGLVPMHFYLVANDPVLGEIIVDAIPEAAGIASDDKLAPMGIVRKASEELSIEANNRDYQIAAPPAETVKGINRIEESEKINETAGKLLNYLSPGSSSSPVADSKGGIDFRALPITTQPGLNTQINNMPAPGLLVNVNLDESLAQIRNMINAGIIPSNERIKEYLQSCYGRKDIGQGIDKILACIADILRIQEEEVVETDLSLKEMLALIESNKPVNEMQAVLARISVEEKEPLVVTE